MILKHCLHEPASRQRGWPSLESAYYTSHAPSSRTNARKLRWRIKPPPRDALLQSHLAGPAVSDCQSPLLRNLDRECAVRKTFRWVADSAWCVHEPGFVTFDSTAARTASAKWTCQDGITATGLDSGDRRRQCARPVCTRTHHAGTVPADTLAKCVGVESFLRPCLAVAKRARTASAASLRISP